MPIECRADDGALVWVRNPFTGSITYFTHVHKKRSGFMRQVQNALLRGDPPAGVAAETQVHAELDVARRECPFCPGNEERSPEEVHRVSPREVFGSGAAGEWLIRAVRNLIPRIPECCTGGRNESYVVIEDPRHFAEGAAGHDDLFHTALLAPRQFHALLGVDVEIARRALANPAVRHVLIRKNQGRESGASQPHVHNQVIGSDVPFPSVARECEVTAARPELWNEIIQFVRRHDFLIAEREGCVSYFCPFGTFPRSYEVVCIDDWVRGIDLPSTRWRVFAELLYDVLCSLGPMPLDYEIHDGPGVPLHAHVNARHFAYSNIGGTLNLPSTVLGLPHGGAPLSPLTQK